MSKPRGRRPGVPSYLKHAPTGRGFSYVRRSDGGRRMHYHPGPYDSAESRRSYRELVAAVMSGQEVVPQHRRTASESSEWPTVGDLCARFLVHADQHYRRQDGSSTGEAENYTHAMKPLLRLCRDLPTDEVSVRDFKSVREEMVDAGWSRTHINRSVGRLRRLFAWGELEQLVPEGKAEHLRVLPALQPNRSAARETKAKMAVPIEDVRATLPYLSPQLRAMIRLQLSTGARPGEVCDISMSQIDHRDSDAWLYIPRQHKNSHRGQDRIIPLLADDQELLQPFLRNDDLPLFQPKEAEEHRHREQRAARKSKVTPSQRARKPKAKPNRAPGDRYDSRTYARAVARATKKAGVPSWSPNQLRKTAAQTTDDALGRDAARTTLGHSDDRSLKHYVRPTAKQAIEVAKRRRREGLTG